MIDPWGIVIVLAIICIGLAGYGIRVGAQLHDAQISLAILRDRLRKHGYEDIA